MASVAETSGTRRELITGGMRIVKTDLTSVDNAETWAPGLAIIEHFDFAPTTASAGTQWGATISSPASRLGLITFVIESGTLAGSATAWGY